MNKENFSDSFQCPSDCYTCDNWIDCTRNIGEPEIETDESNREFCPTCCGILIDGICCYCDYINPNVTRDNEGYWHYYR
jgi:hypothetical protein